MRSSVQHRPLARISFVIGLGERQLGLPFARENPRLVVCDEFPVAQPVDVVKAVEDLVVVGHGENGRVLLSRDFAQFSR